MTSVRTAGSAGSNRHDRYGSARSVQGLPVASMSPANFTGAGVGPLPRLTTTAAPELRVTAEPATPTTDNTTAAATAACTRRRLDTTPLARNGCSTKYHERHASTKVSAIAAATAYG